MGGKEGRGGGNCYFFKSDLQEERVTGPEEREKGKKKNDFLHSS